LKPVLIVGRGTLGSALLEAEWLRGRPYRAVSLKTENSKNRLDITEADGVRRFLAEEGPFALIVNAAAMSLVDVCEEFPEEARKVNALGARHLALAAEESGIPLIHISTDYVFGAGAGARLIRPDERRAPRSIYGLTKLEAEYAVESIASRHALIRTTWLFGPYREDFVNTTLGRLARGESFGVIADQHGSPTYAKDLAGWIGLAAARLEADAGPLALTLHGVNSGVTTRYEMTLLLKEALRSPSRIHPISRAEFTGWKAVRPVYSALEVESTETALGTALRDWRDALGEYARSEGAKRWIRSGASPQAERQDAGAGR
jgi:dTDP-4-dehydrorhamnose reductase